MFVNRYGKSVEDAQALTERNYQVYEALCKGITHFQFTKVDGSLRDAYGTLVPSYYEGQLKGSDRQPSEVVQVYWDMERNDFRCYKKINVVGVCK